MTRLEQTLAAWNALCSQCDAQAHQVSLLRRLGIDSAAQRAELARLRIARTRAHSEYMAAFYTQGALKSA